MISHTKPYSSKLNTVLWTICIVLMSTWLLVFSGDGSRNGLLVSFMYLSPLLLIISYLSYREMSKTDFLIISIIFLMYIFANIHYSSWRASTFFYSSMFFITYLYFYRLLYYGSLTIKHYINVIRFLIILFFIGIVVQQICLLFGIMPINFTQTEFMRIDDSSQLRINSLAPEPSHVARFVLVFMISYLAMKSTVLGRKYNFKKDIKSDFALWVCYLWSMLTIGSTTALLYVGLTLIPYLNRKNIIYLITGGLIIYFIFSNYDTRSVSRAQSFLPAILEFNIDKMFEADASGAWRVAPVIVLFQHFDWLSLNALIGHGIDYQFKLCQIYLNAPDGAPDGGFFAVMMNYGIIVFSLILMLIFHCCYTKSTKFEFYIILVLVLPFLGLNTQLFWCCLMFMATNKYFIENTI